MKEKPNKPLKNCVSIILIFIALIFTINTGTEFIYIEKDNLVGSLLLVVFVVLLVATFVINQFIEE